MPNSIYEICCNPQPSKQHLSHSQCYDPSRHYTSFNNSYLLNHMHWANQHKTPFLLSTTIYLSWKMQLRIILWKLLLSIVVSRRFTSSFHY